MLTKFAVAQYWRYRDDLPTKWTVSPPDALELPESADLDQILNAACKQGWQYVSYSEAVAIGGPYGQFLTHSQKVIFSRPDRG